MRRMPNAAVTVEELRLSKESLIGNLPAQLETNSDTVGLLMDLYEHDLPLDYYASYMKKVSDVTGSLVQEISKKHLLPKTAIVVAVGDLKRIEPALRKLDIGPIEYRDLEGNLRK